MDKNRYKQQFYDDLKKIAVDIIKIELESILQRVLFNVK